MSSDRNHALSNSSVQTTHLPSSSRVKRLSIDFAIDSRVNANMLKSNAGDIFRRRFDIL